MIRPLLFLFLVISNILTGQNTSFQLFEQLEKVDDLQEVDLVLKFQEDVDFFSLKKSFKLKGISPKQRAGKVLLACTEKLTENLASFEDFIDSLGLIIAAQPISIANSIAIRTTKQNVEKILKYSGIQYADLNRVSIVIADPPSTTERNTLRIPGGHEPGHDLINAPSMWAMGYSGAGTTLLSFDTGFWPAHPAISNRYKGNALPQNQCWFPYDLDSPGDKSNSHGTHTIGTILGLDTATNDTIGVAPGAYFIATDPIVTNVADIKTWEELAMGFEWALNPDGDLNTSDDVPDVINNSWGRPVEGDVEPCEPIMITVFAAIEAAGIANVFSAGNSGPDPLTISAPHNINQGLVNSFTVGAVNLNSNLNIAGFSSRGPSLCGGDSSILIKPEVVAPGVNIRSAVNQDEYDFYQGTSMAAPHVSGAVLLLKEAFPNLTGEDILLALYHSAMDLGDPGEDNDYGMGMIDVLAAYLYLIDQGNVPSPPIDQSYEIAITEIILPYKPYQCDSELSPQIKVKNFGDSVITSFEVVYEIVSSTESFTQTFDLVIQPGQEEVITLNTFNTSILGPFELIISVHLPDDEMENDYLNNQRIFRGNIRPKYLPDPLYSENFENGISIIDWYIFNDDSGLTWDTISTFGLDDSQYSAFMQFYDYTPKLNQKDELISPVFDISAAQSSLILSFDYAYQRRGNSSTLKDTLRVMISPDCGETWNVHWEAYADSLKTIPSNSTLEFFPDSANHWNNKSILLNQYISDNEEIMFKFQTANRNGNNLFIDNVELYFGEEPLSLNLLEIAPLVISPNPSTGVFKISGMGKALMNYNISVINSNGIPISSEIKEVENEFLIDLSGFPSGVYFIRLLSKERMWVEKILKY